MAHFEEVALARFAFEAEDTEASELSPSEYTKLEPIILESVDDRFGIVDGFHRSSGLLQWAQENEREPSTVMVRVVVVDDSDDEDIVADAADGFSSENEEAVMTLLRAAFRSEKPKRRRLVENPSALQAARRTRETFMDRVATKQTQMKWEWPNQIEWVGYCEAVMYASDKWHKPGDFEDYKHVAEAEQKLYATKGFIRDFHTGKPMELGQKMKRMPGRMPGAFAELANIFGVNMRTFDGDYLQVDIARAKLGAAEHPTLGTFLFVYTTAGGVHMVITGKELRVERDGIAG